MDIRDNNKRDTAQVEMPLIDAQLIKDLNDRFPARFPDISWTDREIWMRAGQRSLVDFLTQHFNKQQED